MIEAERHFAGAIELLSELPENVDRDRRELGLQLAVGPALTATKGWASPVAERAYTRARGLCERLGDPPEFFPALWGLWRMHLVRSELCARRTDSAAGTERGSIATDIRADGSGSNLVLDGGVLSRQRASRERTLHL
jgi:hypothetical protein